MFMFLYDVFTKLSASFIVWLLGGLLTLLGVFGKRSFAHMPLVVLFRRIGLVGRSNQSLIAVPGFEAPELNIGRSVEGLPNCVRLVGLLDGFALSRLQEKLSHAFPKESFDLRSHDRVDDFTRPLISVGGASVNEVTGSIMTKSLLQRGVCMQYPEHIAHVLDNTFKIKNTTDGPIEDYGFLVLTKNKWNPEVGCCLAFGIYPTGTWAAVRLLEFPMRYQLIQALLKKSTVYVWFRLIMDRLRLRRFIDLEHDWVVVAKTELAANAVYPGEPKIILAQKIEILPESKVWSRAARADFWRKAGSLPGWTGVAGDEPKRSTHLVLEWLGQHSFAGQTVLDFGCGPGRLFEGFFKQGIPSSLVAMDLDEHVLNRAQKHFTSFEIANKREFWISLGLMGTS